MFTVHAKVTSARVAQMIRSNQENCQNKGICLSCGKTIDGCEPDARAYSTCPKGCVRSVYGAEEILLQGLFAGVPVKSEGKREREPEDAVRIEILKDAMGANLPPAVPSDLDREFDDLLNEIG